MRFAIIIEKAGNNYAAYTPDVDGVITTGPTIEATLKTMQEAFAFHVEGLLLSGEALPQPSTPISEHWVEVSIAAIAR